MNGRSRLAPTEPLQVKPETNIARRIVANPYFDLGVLFMILVSILLLIVEIALPSKNPYFDFVVYSGDIITCLFVVELIIRFVASKRKRRFFNEYFIDILAVLPLFRAFRFLRFLRLLRMLRLFRFRLFRSRRLDVD